MPGASQSQPFTVTSDVAALFGNSDGNADDSSVVTNTTLGDQLTPSPQVFAIDAWEDVEPIWTYESGTIDLSLYRLSVETVDNEAFGVKAGQSGTVDVYVSRNPGSAPAPYQTSNLTAYAQNFDVFRKAVGAGGFDYLSESFGVVSNRVQRFDGVSSSKLFDRALTVSETVDERFNVDTSQYRSEKRRFSRKGIRGSEGDDIILHPKTKTVVRGRDGADLHLMNHADRSHSRSNRIARSVIVDFDEDDKILLRRRQFGRNITFEHAMNRRQRRRFQRSEADFVFFDRGAQPGAHPHLSSSLYFNANGSKPGWGDEGGLFVHFRNGFDLTISDLASF